VSYLAGIHAGLWLLGALTPLAIVAGLVTLVWAIDVPHRVRVLKLHRQTRRAGRGLNLGPRRSACTCPDPGIAARSGHLASCPLRPYERS
jgi:hypothetical protein